MYDSGKEGIFLAGAVTGPKTIPETLSEARASALAIHNYLSKKAIQ
jgi:heterodisulfide reductase subunit A